MSDDTPENGNPRAYSRMSREELALLKSLYESGDWTQQQLADRFKRDISTISNNLKTMGVKKGATQEYTNALVAEKIREDEKRNAVERVKRAQETKDEHYRYARDVSKLIMAQVATAVREMRDPANPNPQAFSKYEKNFKSMKAALDGLAAGQVQRNVALGLDKGDITPDEDLPELGIFEMTKEEIEEIQRKATQGLKSDEEFYEDAEAPQMQSREEDYEPAKIGYDDPIDRAGGDDSQIEDADFDTFLGKL